MFRRFFKRVFETAKTVAKVALYAMGAITVGHMVGYAIGSGIAYGAMTFC